MRTRFLTDFFNTSAASQSLQTLEFLRFPPPQLPSPDLFHFDNLSCFDQVTPLRNNPRIEKFSVDEALTKFVSDVLPQDIIAEIDNRTAREVTSEEKIDGNLDGPPTVVKFETAELLISLEDSCFLHEDKMQIFFEVADAEICQDLLDFSLEVRQLKDIHKSIFYIEDFSVEIQENHRSDFVEDGSLLQGQISSSLRTFPLLEVDETSLGINSYTSVDKHIIFESNEPQQWIQIDELTCDAKEHLFSVEFDILEHLLNNSPVACHKFEVLSANFAPEDIINAIEQSMTDAKQESHGGLADGYSFLTLSPLSFEQLQFFDINCSHFSQVFSDTEIINEAEHSEQMFGDTTLSTFNGLIVMHELILRDDSFKSLPVPLISDHERLLSVQAVVADILLKLKLQPSSTSDGIYLDWHLLEQDICSHIDTSLKMFEDIDTYSINVDMNSCSRMLILEFVLSDAHSNEETEENTKVLNLQIIGNVMDHVSHDGIGSSKLNDICQKPSSGEALPDNKVNRGHQLVESMSQFNDLDFFLNPLEATCSKKQKPADMKLEMNYALPVVSAKSPIKTHDTSKKKQQSLEEFQSRGDFHSSSILSESIKNSGLLHCTPADENNSVGPLEATYEVKDSSFSRQPPQLPSATELERLSTNPPSLTDAIIIVNTQNVDTEMIISRRSTYQRILAMEKEGIQVVERDLNLPVDVLVSAAVCLVLYDSRNIRSRTASSDSSFLPSCVENIAANVLTSISFAFSSCILIFEGEVSFLAGIMESSDELYAAAASLGIDLQLFCSYSSEITDEIILNCIAHAAKSTRGLYPKMPESETLAESFLTKFPSFNPLSAHSILSSVGTLIEFLKMSHQQRVCAVRKYLVPDASITLFSALCKYGEREDSRSGMTDCCSSVSSGHDSGNCCPQRDHEQKKRKYIDNCETRAMGMPMDYLFQFEKNHDVTWDPPKTVNSQSWNLESEGIGKSNIALDDINFRENRISDPSIMLNPPALAKQCNIQMSKVAELSGEINVPNLKATETSFGQSKKLHTPLVNKSSSYTNHNFKGLHRGTKGEIIDIEDDDYDDVIAGEDFTFMHSVCFSPTTEKGSAPDIFGTTKRFSSDWCSLPSFPTAAEISSDLDSWIPTKDNGQNSSKDKPLYSHIDMMSHSTPLEQQHVPPEECSMVNSPVNFSRPPFKEKDSCCRRTPLSKAIFSDQPQKGSPWTMDFLNRIKEKSRQRQQTLPCISSAPCSGYSGNSSKVRKRKSPSIFDFYRYQRSSTMQSIEHKGQKVPIQPSNSSKAVKTSPSLSHTPIDKRTKRKLTFATNGNKGQSKLIWSDETDQTVKRRL